MRLLEPFPLTIALFEVATYVVFFERFLGRKYASKSVYIILYFVYFTLNFVISIYFPDFIAILTICVCVAAPLFAYRGAITQRLFCGGLLLAYSFITENLVMIITSYLSDYPMIEIANHPRLYYIGAYSSKVLLLLLAFVVSGRRKTPRTPVPFTYHIFLLFVIYICVGLSVVDIVLVARSGAAATMLYAMSEIAFMVLSVIVFFVFEKFQTLAEREMHATLVEQQLKQHEQMFALMERQNSEIRTIRHDMENHLSSINQLAATRHYDELQTYISTYITESRAVMARSTTGNAVVDALISEKIAHAEHEKISLIIRTDELGEIFVNPVHLSVVLNNALDNAIEACCALSDADNLRRYIHMVLKTEHDYLVLRITNSSLPVSIVDSEPLMTGKGDKQRHGFGLASIRRVVEHYRGVMYYEYKGGEFILMAQLFNGKVENLS